MPEVRRGAIYRLPAMALHPAVPGVPHLHVVVQDDVLNRSRLDTVVVCGLTSNPRRASEPGNVVLEAGEGGLPRRSVVLVSQVSRVAKAALGEPLGVIAPEQVDRILAGLAFQQRSFDR